MHRVPIAYLLLAAKTRLEGLSSAFRGRRARLEPSEVFRGAAVLLAVLVAAFAVTRLVMACRRHIRRNPWWLFLALCRAHRLRWRQRWLLWQVAKHQRMEHPARLFLEPARFEPAGLGPGLRRRVAELRGVRDQVFAGLAEPIPRTTESAEQGGEPSRIRFRLAAHPLPPVSPTPTLNVPPWPAPQGSPDSVS
jgi:hypothetical protein